MFSYDDNIKKLLKSNSSDLLKLKPTKLVKSLVLIMKEELIQFNFTSNPTYLLVIPKLLNTIMTDHLKATYKYDLFEIYNLTNNILFIKNKPIEIHNTLNKFKTNLFDNLDFLYEDYDKDFNMCKYEFVKSIIFKLKYINEFKHICKTYPYLINMSNKDNKPIIYLVLEHFIKNVKNNNLDNIIYYESIIEAIIKNANISDANINDITNILNNVNNDNFYINDLLFTIKDTRINNREYVNRKFNVEENFKETVMIEASNITLNKKTNSKRCSRKIYTFDGENAKEIDDGISLIYVDGIYKLGVHIADPTNYINYNSEIMNEAKKRTTSIYFGNKCIPMYPINLSGGLMSLNEGTQVWGMSYYFDIDSRTGELIDFKIKNELIKIEKNLTYDYLDQTLIGKTNDFEFYVLMQHLNDLSKILKRSFDQEQIKTEFNQEPWTKATEIVANAMIYTNMNVARHFNERNLPFIYRNHNLDEENIKKLSQIQEKLQKGTNYGNLVKEIERIKNLMPRAYYANSCNGHYGLGIDYYSHATSPLRRLSDNLVNICIKKFYLNTYTGDEKKIMFEELEHICETINTKRISTDIYSNYREKQLIKK